jgi:hypothetical protein
VVGRRRFGRFADAAPWRAASRQPLTVVTACVAVAGIITLVDLHWFHQAVPQQPVVAATQPTEPPSAPMGVAVRPEVNYAVPADPHLKPAAPVVNPAADAMFLTGLQRSGVVITSVPDTILSLHNIWRTVPHLRAGRHRHVERE